MAAMPTPARLVTARFTVVVGAGLAYFMALGMLIPVVPNYVEDVLGGGSIGVGMAVGSLFVGAVVLRPYTGRLGDRFGRRVLIILGAAVVAGSTLLYGVVESLPYLVAMRAVTGIGEAAFFVGAATMITDLAPEERRGEAISYWSIAVYGGLAFGPAFGDFVLGEDRFQLAWLVSAGLAALAAVLALTTRDIPRAAHEEGPTHLLHRAALGPGLVLFLGLIGLAGFTAFVPLYVEDLDMGSDGVFLLYGVLVLVVRIFGARLPDTLGARRAASVALAFSTLGLVVIAIFGSAPGLLGGTVVFAAGMSLLYPALLLLALTGIPDNERASVVGTTSSFFDLSQGLGALVLGGVVAVSDYQGAFAVSAVLAATGFIVLRTRIASRSGRGAAAADAEALPA